MPAFNEQTRIESALSRLDELSSGWGIRLEVIIADDGSTDETLEKAAKWVTAAKPTGMQVTVIRIAHRGKGAAVRAGMHHPGTAPIVGYCDVDLSAGEKALAELLEAVRGGWDVAIASRGLPESVLEIRQPWYREASGRLFNLLLRKVTGIEYRDTQCGLKVFKRDAAREIFKRQRIEGFAFDAEVVLLADRLGYRVKEIPVHWAHDEGSKFSFLKDGTRAVRDIVRVVRRVRRGDAHPAGVPAAAAIDRMATSEDKH
ncbi:MAG: dolichyl-phosphate beta-glucosyltransferase, partial [Actinomycetota bacterium]